MADGELVVPDGHCPVPLEAIDAAFDCVAHAVVDRCSRRPSDDVRQDTVHLIRRTGPVATQLRQALVLDRERVSQPIN